MTIVRSVGERTTEQCMGRLSNPELVTGLSPFVETLRECYQRALDAHEKYLVCIDADVLPEPGIEVRAIEMLAHADAAALSCYDKFSDRLRIVGVSAYRVQALPKAMRLLDKARNKARPEQYLRKACGRMRYDRHAAWGRHGYEQYYRDIYRSARVWAIKHQGWQKRGIIDMWRGSDDPDFAVALAGWEHGTEHGAIVEDNTDGFDEAMTRLGLEEKQPL